MSAYCLGNTPAGYSLGNNIRDPNPYDTKKYPFLLGLAVLFAFLFACFDLFEFFVYFPSNRYKSVPILCVKLMQSNFIYKNRLSRSKLSVSLSQSRRNCEAVTLMQACLLTISQFF